MTHLGKNCRLAAGTLILLLAAGPPLQAGYQSATYDFNTSNVMPPGFYGTVLVEAYTGGVLPGGVVFSPGQVRFTVTAAFLPGYGDPADATNFGIQKFGFNTDLDRPPSDIVVTNSGGTDLLWKVNYDKNISTFGSFSVENQGKGNSRRNPVIVTISNLGSNATLDHFVFWSDTNKGQVPAYFVAHVAGFAEEPGSHYIAVTQAPEPSGILLGLIGLVGLSGIGGWRQIRYRM